MASDRLIQLSQPLERRLNVKYDKLKFKLDSPKVSNYSSKPSSSYYDRLASLAEPRYRNKKYVYPETGYSNNQIKNNCKQVGDNQICPSSESKVTNMKHFNKLIKPIQKQKNNERNLIKVNTKAMEVEESDQITRMNRKTYVTVAVNEEKTPKQIARERLMNLATPRYRRDKYVDSSLQYDVKNQSKLHKRMSQMYKHLATSSFSSSQHRYTSNKEVLQLADGDSSPLQIYYELQRKNRR